MRIAAATAVCIAVAGPLSTRAVSAHAVSAGLVSTDTVRTVPADSVIAIPAPGAVLAVPVDGRVNGYGFAGHVLGVAVGHRDPGAGIAAGAGQELWVFGLAVTAQVTTDGDGDPVVDQPSVSVVFAGDQVAIPLDLDAESAQPPAQVASGDQYFAASVPTGASPVIEMGYGGYSQSFSLPSMSKVGTAPGALYRNPDGWDTVDQADTEQTLPTPYSSADGIFDFPDASITIGLSSATVSYFGPDGAGDPAPDPGQAWLYATLSDPFGDVSNSLQYQTPLTADELSVTVAGDPGVIHPKALPGGTDSTAPAAGFANSLFVDQFAFAVPAGVTAATMAIDVASEQVAPQASSQDNQVDHPGTATFDLTFPAPATPAVPAGAATHPAQLPTLTSASVSSGPAGGGGSPTPWAPIVVIAAVAVAAAAGATVFYRARHARPATAGPDPITDFGGARPAPPPTPSPPTAPRPPTPPVEAPSPPEAASDTATPAAAGGWAEPFQPPEPVGPGGPVVKVLGDIEVQGWAERPNRQIITALAVYLAAQDRPVSLAQIKAAVGVDGDSAQSKKSMRTNLSRLRRCLGAGHLPESAQGAGYQLHDVTSDHRLLVELSAQAADLAEGDPDTAIDTYVRAVALIRGEPYGCHGGYGWVDTAHLRSAIEADTTRTATALARLALERLRADIGLWAARQGQRGAPYDETIAAIALDAAKAGGRPGALRGEWNRIVSDLKARQTEPSQWLTDHYHHLDP